MSAEVVSYMLADKDIMSNLKFRLIFQCAPFLKGIKKASIISIEKIYVKEIAGALLGTGIEYRVLAYKNGRFLVFFYRREEFINYLEKPEIKRFLQSYGYEDDGISEILLRLSHRICSYLREGSGFPHEIGIFLDYPLEDVEGFIKNKGKNSLLTGYWKVYYNPERAQMTFLAYDKAKDSAVNEFLIGKSIQEIAERVI